MLDHLIQAWSVCAGRLVRAVKTEEDAEGTGKGTRARVVPSIGIDEDRDAAETGEKKGRVEERGGGRGRVRSKRMWERDNGKRETRKKER